jgi:hypothetical protein
MVAIAAPVWGFGVASGGPLKGSAGAVVFQDEQTLRPYMGLLVLLAWGAVKTLQASSPSM